MPELKAEDRAKWRQLCKADPQNFPKAPTEAKNDMAVCLDAVRGDGMMLEHASLNLRGNRNIALEAVKNTAECFIYVSDTMKNDWEIVQTVVRSKGQLLRYASEEMRADSELVLEVVHDLWFTVEYAADVLLYDPKFWSDVIEQDPETGWMAFSYAPVELRSNHDLVMLAIRIDPMAFKFASEELRGDPQFVLEAVKVSWICIKHASVKVRRNPEVVLEALKQDYEALQYADPELLKDPDFALQAAGMHGRAIGSRGGGLDSALQDDKAWVLKAVKKNPMALAFLDDDVRDDREVVNESYKGRLPKIVVNGKRGSCSGLKWLVDKDSAKWAKGTTALALGAMAEEAAREALIPEAEGEGDGAYPRKNSSESKGDGGYPRKSSLESKNSSKEKENIDLPKSRSGTEENIDLPKSSPAPKTALRGFGMKASAMKVVIAGRLGKGMPSFAKDVTAGDALPEMSLEEWDGVLG